MIAGVMLRERAVADLAREPVEIVTQNGPVVFDAEVARTAREQSVGLMFRRSLGRDQAMLFTYPLQVVSMWMQNTYISLDMLFIAADGKVVRIARRTEPFSKDLISSGTPVTGVLEINAGEAAARGIKVGDRVKHAHFKSL